MPLAVWWWSCEGWLEVNVSRLGEILTSTSHCLCGLIVVNLVKRGSCTALHPSGWRLLTSFAWLASEVFRRWPKPTDIADLWSSNPVFTCVQLSLDMCQIYCMYISLGVKHYNFLVTHLELGGLYINWSRIKCGLGRVANPTHRIKPHLTISSLVIAARRRSVFWSGLAETSSPWSNNVGVSISLRHPSHYGRWKCSTFCFVVAFNISNNHVTLKLHVSVMPLLS